MNAHDSFEVKPFPTIRRATIDVLDAGQRKHMIHGLLEVDVSRPRRLIREHKAQTGESLSFTAFIIYCLGRAVDQNRHMHAYRDLRNRLILFKEVDVSTTVEREIDGHKEVMPTIIRAANKKDVVAIHSEIRAAQSEKPEEASLFRFIQLYLALPGFIRRLWSMGIVLL